MKPVTTADDLRETRASIFDKLQALNDRARAENRDLTEREALEFDRLQDRFDAVSRQIERAEVIGGRPAMTRRAVSALPFRVHVELRTRGGALAREHVRDALVELPDELPEGADAVSFELDVSVGAQRLRVPVRLPLAVPEGKHLAVRLAVPVEPRYVEEIEGGERRIVRDDDGLIAGMVEAVSVRAVY